MEGQSAPNNTPTPTQTTGAVSETIERMPHINLPTNLGIRYALLPGDPARVDRIAKHLTDVEQLGFNREYKSLRGKFQGVDVLVMSTGMGGPSTAIAVEELKKIGVTAAIRVGSCGALQPGMRLGEVVVVNGAVRDEGTSKGYAPVAYPAIPDFELMRACVESARKLRFRHRVGLTRSHDCLYGEENEHATEIWTPRHVMASEQETAALFVVGMMRGIRTASVLNVVAGYKGDLISSIGSYASGSEATQAGELHEILIALNAFVKIDRMFSAR